MLIPRAVLEISLILFCLLVFLGSCVLFELVALALEVCVRVEPNLSLVGLLAIDIDD